MKKIFLVTLFVLAGSPWMAAHADGKEAAVIACTDKDDGDACEYNNPQGETANGACHKIPNGDAKLICVEYTPG